MTIYISDMIWTVICFLVLLFVLKKFLFGPLGSFMKERDAKIAAGLKAGEDAREARASNDAAILEGKKAAGAEAGAILAEAHTRDEQARSAAVSSARSDAAHSMRDVREALRDEEKQSEAELEEKVPGLAQTLAGALLRSGTE